MATQTGQLTIGTLAKLAGVNVETIRYYQRKRLMREPARPPGGIRRYTRVDAARVRFVKSAQTLGFSLREVAQLLELEDGTHCREAAKLAALHLAEVRARLTDLARMEKALSALVRQCESRRGSIACPLIASLRRAGSMPPHRIDHKRALPKTEVSRTCSGDAAATR